MARGAGKTQLNTAVGYVRRSTDKQEQSIPEQKKAINAFAVANDLKLLKFYVDDAISGTSTVKRKAFLQMLEDAESNLCEFKYIIVYDVKRFGRLDNDEAGYYRHKFRMCGVEIMLGYVQEKDFNHWFDNVNSWIAALISDKSEKPEWTKEEQIKKIQITDIGEYQSTHCRIKEKPILLHHFWIKLFENRV